MDYTNLLIGISVIITTVAGLFVHIRYCKSPCSTCIQETKDIESLAVTEVKRNPVVARAIWNSITNGLSPKSKKELDKVITEIEVIGSSSKDESDKIKTSGESSDKIESSLNNNLEENKKI
jgi:hypothetical protein